MKKYGKAILLLIIAFVFIVLSWIIQGGSLTDGIYTATGYGRAGIYDFFLMFYYTFYYKASDIFYLFVIGGFYGVLSQTDSYRKLISTVSKAIRGKESWAMLVITLIMALITAFTNNILSLMCVVPFVVTVFLRRGCNKISAVNASFGGIFIGLLGQLLGTYGSEYLYTATGVTVSNGIVFKICMFVIAYILYNLFAVIYMKKNIKKSSNETNDMFPVEISENRKLKKGVKVWPISLILGLGLIILILGYINWGMSFNVSVFEDLLTKFKGFEISGVPVAYNLLGNFTAFGSWDILCLSFVLLVIMLIILTFNKMSLNDFLANFGMGMQKSSRLVLIYILACALFVCSYYFTWPVTLINFIIGSGKFNIFTLLIAGIIISFLCVDLDFSSFLIGSYIKNAYADNLVNATLIVHFGYAISALFVPTSVILMLALSYLDISYKEWLKYIWKFLLLMIVFALIAFAFMCYV